jgi:hypothetical protein
MNFVIKENQLKKNRQDLMNREQVKSNDLFLSIEYYNKIVNEIEKIGWHKWVLFL